MCRILFVLASILVMANSFKCPTKDGYFPADPGKNCAKYYKCTKGVPTSQSCGKDEGFHPDWKKCTWEGFVDGCSTGNKENSCGIVDTVDEQDPRRVAPWLVAVFQRDESGQGWTLVGPGAIISPTTIITTCRLGKQISERFRFNMKASSFLIVAGMGTVDLSVEEDSRQNFSVAAIQLNPHSSANSHSFCNSIIHLKGRINLNTPYAKAICLPIFSSSTKAPKAIGYSGSGKIAAYMERSANSDGFAHITSVDYKLTSEVFCFARTFQKTVYCGVNPSGTSGKGLENICASRQTISSFRSTQDKRWYLLGRGSDFNNQVCELQGLESDISLPWIVNSIRCGSSKFPCHDGKCIDLYQVCNGETDCANGEDEEPKTCRAMNPCIFDATFECGVYENCINSNKVCDGYPDCYDASDENPTMCQHSHRKNVPFYSIPEFADSSSTENTLSVSETSSTEMMDPVSSTPSSDENISNRPEKSPGNTCPELVTTEETVLSCSAPGIAESKPCPKYPTVGTIATYKCAAFHKGAIYGEDSLTKKCGGDFQWRPSRDLLCVRDCGRTSKSLETSAYIVNGQHVSSKDRFPWHTAIFIKSRNKQVYICGGTLIRPNFVLTAAHCVTDTYGDNNKKPDIFTVAVAPSTSNYEHLIADPKSQVVGVRKIVVNSHFDPSNNYQSDIAILALNKSVEMNENVITACLPADDSQDPMPGTKGRVSGFGIDGTGNVSESLMFANLPIVSTETCRTAVGFIPSVNQICAGYSNGTGVCFGDSGGGLVFLQNDRYFLQGIVSVGPKKDLGNLACDYTTYSVYTSVPRFVDWLRSEISMLEMDLK